MEGRTSSDTQQTDDRMRSIAEAELESGIARATLRIWERRYGFPAPARDARGERCYPQEQVELLLSMRHLIGQGHRPAALIAAGADAIRILAAGPMAARTHKPTGGSRLLRLLRQHDAAAVGAELGEVLGKVGLERFAGEELPALIRMIGDCWHRGELEIYEEHLFSDSVVRVLRGATKDLRGAVRPEAPRVLLTTLPDEPHALGLLMAEAMFALQGCPCVSLGVDLPVAQIVSAARTYRADLVGLSFASHARGRQVRRLLQELRGLLPADVRVWAGGSAPVLSGKPVAGVRVIADVRHVAAALAEDFALPPL